jgi:2,4-dienoyl-CoA reductase (NADPH2)
LTAFPSDGMFFLHGKEMLPENAAMGKFLFFLSTNSAKLSKKMTRHEPFSFPSSTELLQKAKELDCELPFQESIAPLFDKMTIGSQTIANRLAVQPMEGFDAEPDGSPSELTFRRYRRYAEGGSGLIWFEATSVISDGRSNPHQLTLDQKNLVPFQRLVERTRSAGRQVFGGRHEIFLVLQLTHSGRYSRPEGKPSPQVAGFNPFLDRAAEDVRVLTDDEIDRLQDKFVDTTRLAKEAGFDAVDIKACHGYLVNELLAAYDRKDSRYGQTFENRTRFLCELVQRIRDAVPGLSLAVRLSVFDGISGGFGVSRDNSERIDFSEPKELIRTLIQSGVSLLNITAGNPSQKPHLGRPFDRPLPGASPPEEHPLEGVCRLLKLAAEFQKGFPDIPLVGTGYSWLRQYLPGVGAAVVQKGEASFIGLGRSSFAYPDAPRELMAKGRMDSAKVCLTCSRCTELMRNGWQSGCVVRDKEIYGRLYERLSAKGKGNEEESD